MMHHKTSFCMIWDNTRVISLPRQLSNTRRGPFWPDQYLRPPMRCPSTGPERSLLVHPSQSHLSPRTSYRLAAAAKTQGNREGRNGKVTQRASRTERLSGNSLIDLFQQNKAEYTRLYSDGAMSDRRVKPKVWPRLARCVTNNHTANAPYYQLSFLSYVVTYVTPFSDCLTSPMARPSRARA